MVLRELLKGLLAVSDRRHPVVLALEIGRHRVTDGLLVFNKQYTSRLVAHGYHLKSSPARIPPGRVSHTRSAPSVQVVFAFIVAITPEAAGTCAGNDTISTMVTRRSTHAHHAKPSRVGARNAQRRNAMPGGGTYAGGKPDSCGGHVGNVGGFGSGGLGASGASRPAARRNAAQKASVGPGGALGSGGVHRRGAGGAGSGSVGSGGSGGGGIHVPTPNGGEVLLTRRHFLFGAIGVTALAAAGGAASVVLKQREEAAGNVTVLEVPASAVTALNTSASESAFTLVEDASARMGLSVRARAALRLARLGERRRRGRLPAAHGRGEAARTGGAAVAWQRKPVHGAGKGRGPGRGFRDLRRARHGVGPRVDGGRYPRRPLARVHGAPGRWRGRRSAPG